MTTSQLPPLLAQLQSTHNETRKNAEEAYKLFISQAPEEAVRGICNCVRERSEIQTFAAVLLRRLLTQTQEDERMIWDELPLPTQQNVKQSLLDIFMQNTQESLRSKLCDIIADLSKNILMDNEEGWPQLLQTLYTCINGQDTAHKTSAFEIIAAAPEIISEQSSNILKQVFAIGLEASNPTQVKVAAFKAIIAYLCNLDDVKKNPMCDALHAFETLLNAFANDEDALTDLVSCLADLATLHPKVIKPLLPSIAPRLLDFCTNQESESVRHTSLEFFVTLAEAGPAMFRKAAICDQLVPICLKMTATITDDEDWHTNIDTEDDEESATGSQAIDRLALALGGAYLMPIIYRHLPPMFNSGEWTERVGALLVLSVIAEGCGKYLSKEIGNFNAVFVAALSDSHPRVQHAGCQCIGQLCTDFQPDFQKLLGTELMPHFINLLNNQHPRVVSHGAAALTNFLEDADFKIVRPFYPDLAHGLMKWINAYLTGADIPTYILENCITCLATLAECAGEEFATAFETVLPPLFQILSASGNANVNREIIGRTLECVSLICLSTGAEKTKVHFDTLVQAFTTTQNSQNGPDDPVASYLLSAWARIGSVMGQEFLPYLDAVMGPLFAGASITAEYAILNGESDKASDDGWDVMQASNDTKVGVKTAVLDDKATAVDLMGIYAKNMGLHFAKHVPKTLEISVPLINFYFHQGVRSAACTTVSEMFVVMKKANADTAFISEQLNLVLPNLCKAVEIERDPEMTIEYLTSINEIIMTLPSGLLSPTILERLLSTVQGCLTEYFERLQSREETRLSEDYDAEYEEALADEDDTDEEVSGELSRVIHAVFKNLGPAFLPYFQQMIPRLGDFVRADTVPALQWVLCIFDDLIQFGGAESQKYESMFFPLLEKCLSHASPALRQAASYGVGLCAQYGASLYGPKVRALLPNLFAIAQHPEARSEDNQFASENATSAIGKICQFAGSGMEAEMDNVLSAWINLLPITGDEEEAPFVYMYVLRLFKSGWTGHNMSSRMISVLAKAICCDVLEESKNEKTAIVEALREILNTCSAELKGEVWSSLDAGERVVIQKELSA